METPLRDDSLGFGTQGGSSVRPPDSAVPEIAPPSVQARPATGGAQTLQDILARQRGEIVDDSFRSNAEAVGMGPTDDGAGSGALEALGGASDPELWRAMRYDTADLTVTARGPAADVLIQDGGMAWLQFREGPLPKWGGIAMLGMAGLLAVFYLLAGRVRIEGGKDGRTLTRFISVERFAHWLLSGSFIILGLTGLLSLFGRKVFIPAFGHEAYASVAAVTAWLHDNVSWAFMLALVMIFVLWVWDNLPDRTDLTWIAQGGGLIGKGHPPAKKFNFGQKIIFWSVIVLGTSISVSGLALLFPFELQLFAPTFEKLNAIGLPQLLGFGPLDTNLAPHEEMQLSQLWHAIVAFVLMTIIIAHIYIGSLGMEGAFDAMGSGQVDENWAEQHHSIWAEEKKAEERGAGGAQATPAE
ncbi:formate dehydrogenase subunit gamma [Maribius pontilimi]|uniref:Formate dehydrogenase subunit gamma n=2 Tax=Palleronia pontilimi TaxID=1964209 RepID=A0A934IJN5_9RHOB|nr:formate dehydrogenase subunit gamma [Palleronia pontilimi]